jgi:hypothetical protein
MGATMKSKHRVAFYKLKQELVSKRRDKLSKKSRFFKRVNAVPHKKATLKFWNTRPTHLIWPLLTDLKKYLQGRKFSSIEEATLAADG